MFHKCSLLDITYNSKERKRKKFNKAFDQLDQIFKQLETKNINTPHKKIIYLKLLLLKLQAWKCRRKFILCQFCHGSSGMHLLSIFRAFGQKMEVLLSIFCGTKITLQRITPSPIFRSTPPLCYTQPLIIKFFQPHIIQYL